MRQRRKLWHGRAFPQIGPAGARACSTGPRGRGSTGRRLGLAPGPQATFVFAPRVSSGVPPSHWRPSHENWIVGSKRTFIHWGLALQRGQQWWVSRSCGVVTKRAEQEGPPPSWNGLMAQSTKLPVRIRGCTTTSTDGQWPRCMRCMRATPARTQAGGHLILQAGAMRRQPCGPTWPAWCDVRCATLPGRSGGLRVFGTTCSTGSQCTSLSTPGRQAARQLSHRGPVSLPQS